jgi:hypothetical protein
MIMVADDRAEATSRLDDLMKTRIMPRRSRRAERWRTVMIASGVLVGIGLAMLMKQPKLLADRELGTVRYQDPWKQVYHAKIYDTVAAWQAAVAKASDDQFCLNLARMGLASRLLRVSEYAAALDPLTRLADAPDTVSETFPAFGRAGLVVAYTHLGRDEEAIREYTNFVSSMRERLKAEAPTFYNGLYLEAEKELLLRNI